MVIVFKKGRLPVTCYSRPPYFLILEMKIVLKKGPGDAGYAEP